MSLLDPDFVRRLSRLRVLAQRRFAGATGGIRRSIRRGSSAEFADHRPYCQGDDVRRIDWNAYARLEELILRLYVAEEDLTLYLLVDTSRSLAVGNPPKIDTAKQVAAALGYVALSGSERVAVIPWGAGIKPPMAPVRGRRRIAGTLRYLDGLECDGETDLSRAVDELLSRRRRPGLVAVISDLMDPGGYRRPIDRLIAERFEPVLFHVLDHEELEPTPGGDLVLVDSERGHRVKVSLDARAVRAYRRRLDAFLDGVDAYARKRGIACLRVGGSVPFEAAVLEYLKAG